MGKKGLQYMITDSWEAGTQNWTDNMIAEFSRRRGYDMLQWIPALTGRIVKDSKESDRFLWTLERPFQICLPKTIMISLPNP